LPIAGCSLLHSFFQQLEDIAGTARESNSTFAQFVLIERVKYCHMLFVIILGDCDARLAVAKEHICRRKVASVQYKDFGVGSQFVETLVLEHFEHNSVCHFLPPRLACNFVLVLSAAASSLF